MSGRLSSIFNNQTQAVQASQIERLLAQQQQSPQFFPVNFQPLNLQQGYGANRFLTGNMGAPLNFNIPQATYSQIPFVPAPFNQAPKLTTSGENGIIGYTSTGDPIYSQNPAPFSSTYFSSMFNLGKTD